MKATSLEPLFVLLIALMIEACAAGNQVTYNQRSPGSNAQPVQHAGFLFLPPDSVQVDGIETYFIEALGGTTRSASRRAFSLLNDRFAGRKPRAVHVIPKSSIGGSPPGEVTPAGGEQPRSLFQPVADLIPIGWLQPSGDPDSAEDLKIAAPDSLAEALASRQIDHLILFSNVRLRTQMISGPWSSWQGHSAVDAVALEADVHVWDVRGRAFEWSGTVVGRSTSGKSHDDYVDKAVRDFIKQLRGALD